MTKIYKVLVTLLIIANVSSLYAHGKKDIETKSVENLNSWQEEFDLDSKKEGKFNIVITASDMGGNSTIEGAHNIRYDKRSDLPVIGIINPSPEMRVDGSLNIVGTCIDDDGVSRVELVLDEGTEWEQIVTAEGTEYWSYFLDTNALEEGPHTVRVIGYDTNEDPRINNPKKVKADNSTVTWQLDRTQPNTQIQNHAMGTIVRGSVKLEGIVYDGNGINDLSYSVDNGKTFKPIKIKLNKKHPAEASFTLSIDTKKFDDGAKVIWFKSHDAMGSVGLSSYLLFVDNTEPEVEILSPDASEIQSGLFSVAGYAKDEIGIESLTWYFGNESGDIEVIPGNPYWYVELDSTKVREKAGRFVIHVQDSIGNVVDKVLLIPIDQNLEKPVIEVESPIADKIYSGDELVIARGFVSGKNTIESVSIQLDDQEPVIQETLGDYSWNFGPVSALSVGEHKITVIAYDVTGVKGNTVVTKIKNEGGIPVFENKNVVTNGESTAYVQGITIDPEAGSVLSIDVVAAANLSSVTKTTIFNGSVSEEIFNQIKGSTYTIKIPVNHDSPKGLVRYSIRAEDEFGRSSEFIASIYVKNTTKVYSEEKIEFGGDVSSEGAVVVNREYPITGYFVGGRATSVSLMPAGNAFGIRAELDGNIIKFSYGTHDDSIGSTEPITVRVTTDKGHTVESIPLTFYEDNSVPSISIDGISIKDERVTGIDFEKQMVDISEQSEEIIITGKATCPTDLGSVQYRLIEVRPTFDGRRLLNKLSLGTVSEFQDVSVDYDGSFTITYENFDLIERTIEKTILPDDFDFPELTEEDEDWGVSEDSDEGWGMSEDESEEAAPEFEVVTETVYLHNPKPDAIYVVEIVASSAGGKKTVNAIALDNIKTDPKDPAKDLAKAKPQVIVIDGFEDYAKYGIASFQGNLVDVDDGYEEPRTFEIFSTEGFAVGQTETVSISAKTENGVLVSSPAVVLSKNPDLEVHLKSMKVPAGNSNDYEETGLSYVTTPYANGSIFVLPYKGTNGSSLTVEINTEVSVSSVDYNIGGISGKVAKLPVKTPGEPLLVDIPLNDLPNGENLVAVKVKAGNLEKQIFGKIIVVRKYNDIDDEEKIYGFASAEAGYRSSDNTIILGPGASYYLYANCLEPMAELTGDISGLTINQEGNLFEIKASRDGSYRNIVLVITDRYGDTYYSESLNFVADALPPEVVLVTPEFHGWTSDILQISGTATDGIGVKTVEYSIDGENWGFMSLSGPETAVTFNQTVSLEDIEDGLIPVTIKVTDTSDQIAYCYTSVIKDVTPPEVSVITPMSEDVVNGRTMIVFKATDNINLDKIQYLSADNSIVSDVEINSLVHSLVGDEERPISSDMIFEFTDSAGNKTTLNAWEFNIEPESDLPICEIHVPEENTVITRDFSISGVAFDDDGDSTIYLKIDDGEFEIVQEKGTSFEKSVPITAMTDNEHTITVYAVDNNGVQGPEVTREFRVSLAEPTGAILLPTIDESVKGNVRLSGLANDANGIESVQISLDNGNSYNDVEGLEEWFYNVDTRAIPGGTHAVFLKIVDKYGIHGLYSSLINIDNDAPGLILEQPVDDSFTKGILNFSGYTYDNVEISELTVTFRSLDSSVEPVTRELEIKTIIGQTIDITNLPDGGYNVEVTAKDKAGNVTNVSRNVTLQQDRDAADVSILYPLNGEHKQANFSVYGQSSSDLPIELLRLYIDDVVVDETELTESGYFRFDVTSDTFEVAGETSELPVIGRHKYRVDTVLSNGLEVRSKEQTITYSPYGPWITIDNFEYGSFAINRPIIKGKAGYTIDPEEKEHYKSKDATDDFKEEYLKKKLVKVEISFDNGQTFQEISKGGSWKYRIENLDIPEGEHFMLVRAVMENGEIAINRTVIHVDNTKPTIKMIAPKVEGSYNQILEVSGLAHDDYKLKEVTVALRKGDKSSYEIPELIQGLYFDFHFLGATFFEVGTGLTFFDDVVKLQVQWGQFTQDQRNLLSTILGQPMTNMRYGGDNIWGVKVLANVYTLPFSTFWGRDFEWLYASLAVGAQFTWFNDGGFKSSTTTEINTQTLSAIIVQLEFPLLKYKRKVFSQFSFYTEFSYWFIPTDVSSSTSYVIQNQVPQLAVGLRMNVF